MKFQTETLPTGPSDRSPSGIAQGALTDITEKEVTFDMHRRDKEALEFDITSCRFAEFFRAPGEPELGALLVCATDVDIVEAAGDEVSFSRSQTIMQGAPCCTFRYKFEPR